MNPYRILVVLAAAVLFIFVSQSWSEEQITETSYHCKVKSNESFNSINSILRYFYSLRRLDDKVFTFKGSKECGPEPPRFREFDFFSNKRHLAHLSLKDGKYAGFAKFGSSSKMSGEFKPEQIEIMFEIYDFVLQAGIQDTYSVAYRTDSNSYFIKIEAVGDDSIKIGENDYNVIFFKMKVRKYSDHFADIYVWRERDEKKTGQVLKCVISMPWAHIILNIENSS